MDMLGSYYSAMPSDVRSSCADWYKSDLLSFERRKLSPVSSAAQTPIEVADTSEFEFMINVSPYEANDIFITTQGEYLCIEGKHEEIPEENGFVAREFIRRQRIPDNVETEKMKAALLPSGMLWVNAPRKTQEPETPGTLRNITIRLESPGLQGGIGELPAKAVAIPVTRGVPSEDVKEAPTPVTLGGLLEGNVKEAQTSIPARSLLEQKARMTLAALLEEKPTESLTSTSLVLFEERAKELLKPVTRSALSEDKVKEALKS